MTSTPILAADRRDPEQLERVKKAMAKKFFCVLSTTSPIQRPHAAGVIHVAVGTTLHIHTMRSSRKARNIAQNPFVGVCIPVRKLPVGPPFNVSFQGMAEILDMDHPDIVALVKNGTLKRISSHGELEEPDGCYLRIRPIRTIHTYGIGVPVMGIIKDPLHNGARSVDI